MVVRGEASLEAKAYVGSAYAEGVGGQREGRREGWRPEGGSEGWREGGDSRGKRVRGRGEEGERRTQRRI